MKLNVFNAIIKTPFKTSLRQQNLRLQLQHRAALATEHDVRASADKGTNGRRRPEEGHGRPLGLAASLRAPGGTNLSLDSSLEIRKCCADRVTVICADLVTPRKCCSQAQPVALVFAPELCRRRRAALPVSPC